MKCHFFKVIQVWGWTCLVLGSALFAENWMWHGAFPWVYSYDQEAWIYWRPGMDGRFYQWSNSQRIWQIYNEGAEEWQSVQPADLNETKWQAWEQDSQSFGGDYTLQKIKRSIVNSESYLDLSYQRISDLSPLSETTHLRKLYLQANQFPTYLLWKGLKILRFFTLARTKSTTLAH